MTRVVVVGGGITGLVAARDAAMAGAEVTLVDPGALGGKVRSSAFDGGSLDEAADAFLARVPEGVELCRALGIEGDLVSPATRRPTSGVGAPCDGCRWARCSVSPRTSTSWTPPASSRRAA